LAWIVALTLSIEKMFRNNFYAIAGVVAGINLMQVACSMGCAAIAGHKKQQLHDCREHRQGHKELEMSVEKRRSFWNVEK
jgi:hypothetical protein